MRPNRRYSIAALLGALLFIITSPVSAQLNLNSLPDGTGDDCWLKPGKTCFHVFTSSHTETTGDSNLFEVNMCTIASYYFKSDGSATVKVMESATKSKTGATIFAPDWDGDGVVTAVDEATAMDASVGRRDFYKRPRAPWQYVDVIVAPSTGSAVLTISCD